MKDECRQRRYGDVSMDKILMTLCYLISCFIVTCIVFQFMDEGYHRTYQNRFVYVWSGIGDTIFITAICLRSYRGFRMT